MQQSKSLRASSSFILKLQFSIGIDPHSMLSYKGSIMWSGCIFSLLCPGHTCKTKPTVAGISWEI